MANTPDTNWQEQVLDWLQQTDEPAVFLGSAEVYAYPSESDPMGFNYVVAFPDFAVCTCKGFRFRNKCHHVEEHQENVQKGLT